MGPIVIKDHKEVVRVPKATSEAIGQGSLVPMEEEADSFVYCAGNHRTVLEPENTFLKALWMLLVSSGDGSTKGSHLFKQEVNGPGMRSEPELPPVVQDVVAEDLFAQVPSRREYIKALDDLQPLVRCCLPGLVGHLVFMNLLPLGLTMLVPVNVTRVDPLVDIWVPSSPKFCWASWPIKGDKL